MAEVTVSGGSAASRLACSHFTDRVWAGAVLPGKPGLDAPATPESGV